MSSGTHSDINTRVVIDAGHGGKDSGAVIHSPTTVMEKDLNLQILFGVKQRLDNYFPETARDSFIYTRLGDYFLSLEMRADLANINNANLFISIHCNAAENPKAEGFSVYTSVGETPADAIADTMLSYLENTFRNSNLSRVNRGSKERSFKVLTHTICPALLVEAFFMTNPRELRDRHILPLTAGAIALTIRDFMRLRASNEQ